MALTDPIQHFSICRVVPYNKTTGEFYGAFRVLQNSSFSLTGETISNNGGCSKYPWSVSSGLITAELSLSFSEFPPFAYEIFLGKKPTEATSETTGNVSSITDKTGTSITDATDGLSVAATGSDESDLKFGRYVIKAVTASTFDVYYAGADIARGTDGTYQNDLLKINASPLSFTVGTVAIAEWGLTFTELGAASFTVDDTAVFDVRPINSRNYEATFGGSADEFIEFGALLYTPVNNGQAIELDVFRLKATGMPHNLVANEYATVEVTATAFYDASKDGVFKQRTIII